MGEMYGKMSTRDEFSGEMTPGRKLREGVYPGEVFSRRGWGWEYS